MSYDIEMLWECSLCNKRGNRGLKDRYCVNCGHKKDESDSEYMPDDISYESAALDGWDAKQARAGTDWVCMYCESVQNQLNKCCSNCGAVERGTKKVAAGKVTADSRTRAPRINSDAPATVSIRVPAPTRPRRRVVNFWRPAAAVTVCLLLALAGWWLFSPRTVMAHVAGLAWRHDVVIDRYSIHTHEGWDPGYGAFNVTPLGMRHHHYDRVAVGSHREPYMDRYSCGQDCTTSPSYTTCSSNGNGTARCTQHGGTRSCSTRYCTRTAYRSVTDYQNVSRQRMWFGWYAWDWAYNRTVSKTGTTSEASWPSSDELKPISLGPGEQERNSRREEYAVKFHDVEGSDYTYRPDSYEEFKEYNIDDLFQLKVNHAGSVEVLP